MTDILHMDLQKAHAKVKQKTYLTPDPVVAGSAYYSCYSDCFSAGMHYFQDLSERTVCAKQRPYFLLYSPKTHNLHGLGLGMYGRPSKADRGWFETPSAKVAKVSHGVEWTWTG